MSGTCYNRSDDRAASEFCAAGHHQLRGEDLRQRWDHKIIKRKNGKKKVVIDNLANFLSISPKQTKFFPSVCLVPAEHFCYFGFILCSQLNYCWILKLLSGLRILKLLNLCGNQVISMPLLLMWLFHLFLGKNSKSLIWNDIGRNCLLVHRMEIAKFLMRTFTLPIYLPLWVRFKEVSGKEQTTAYIWFPIVSGEYVCLCIKCFYSRKVIRQTVYWILLPLSSVLYVCALRYASKEDWLVLRFRCRDAQHVHDICTHQ